MVTDHNHPHNGERESPPKRKSLNTNHHSLQSSRTRKSPSISTPPSKLNHNHNSNNNNASNTSNTNTSKGGGSSKSSSSSRRRKSKPFQDINNTTRDNKATTATTTTTNTTTTTTTTRPSCSDEPPFTPRIITTITKTISSSQLTPLIPSSSSSSSSSSPSSSSQAPPPSPMANKEELLQLLRQKAAPIRRKRLTLSQQINILICSLGFLCAIAVFEVRLRVSSNVNEPLHKLTLHLKRNLSSSSSTSLPSSSSSSSNRSFQETAVARLLRILLVEEYALLTMVTSTILFVLLQLVISLSTRVEDKDDIVELNELGSNGAAASHGSTASTATTKTDAKRTERQKTKASDAIPSDTSGGTKTCTSPLVPAHQSLLLRIMYVVSGIVFMLSSAVYLAGKYVSSQGDCYWPMMTTCLLLPHIISRRESKLFIIIFSVCFTYIVMLNLSFGPLMCRFAIPYVTSGSSGGSTGVKGEIGDDEHVKQYWLNLFQTISHDSLLEMMFTQLLESIPIYAIFVHRTRRILCAEQEIERKNRKVRDQENMMEAILSSLPAFFWVIDRNLVFRFCRGTALHQAKDSFHGTYEGMKLTDFFNLMKFDSKSVEQALGYYSEVMNGKSVEFETASEAPPNHPERRICLKSWLKPLKDEDDNIVGCVGLALDVKDVKDLQREKEEFEQNYRSLVESVNDVLFRVDADLKIQFIGKYMFTGLGREWIGRSVLDLLANNRALQEEVSSQMSKLFSEKKRCCWEWSDLDRINIDEQQFAPDKVRYYITKAHPIIKDNVVVAATIVTSDMTERRNLIEQQRIAEKAELISKSKTEFIAQLSHEIRNPLNAILGSLQLLFLTSDTMSCIQCDHLADARENANSLMTIVSDVLDLNKIESGTLELTPEPNSVLEIVESTCCSIAVQAYKKGLRVHSFVDPRIPLSLVCDKSRIGQILMNYASNSIKFTKTGYIILQAVLVADAPMETTIRFECIDTGIGIKKEHQQTIFEQYTQVSVSDEAHQENRGWGLGLRICSLLGNLMHGTVGVESSSDLGSTFYFEVTLSKSETECSHIANIMPRANFDHVFAVSIPLELERYLSEYLKYMGVHELRYFHQESECVLYIQQCVQPSETVLIFTDSVHGLSDVEHSWKIITLIESHNWYKAQQAKNCTPLRLPIRLKHLVSVINGLNLYSATPPNSPAHHHTVSTIPLMFDPKSIRALYVEDNAVNRKILCLMLEKIGIMHVDQAVNGQEGLEKVIQSPEPYGIIWMDLKMPVMSGQVCAAKIRELNDKRSLVPIIAVTATADARMRHQLDSTFNDIMIKPISLEKVVTMINKYYRESEPTTATSTSSSSAAATTSTSVPTPSKVPA